MFKNAEGIWLKKDHKKIEIICPQCIKNTYAQKFEDFVKKKGGTLLSKYTGRFNTVEIRCKHGHDWKTTPGAVYQGSWCPDCRKKKH
jgi:hypothetical protein